MIFHRTESISRIAGKLRVLDFKHAAVRTAILDTRDADDAHRQASKLFS